MAVTRRPNSSGTPARWRVVVVVAARQGPPWASKCSQGPRSQGATASRWLRALAFMFGRSSRWPRALLEVQARVVGASAAWLHPKQWRCCVCACDRTISTHLPGIR